MDKTYIQDFTEYKDRQTEAIIDDRNIPMITTSDWLLSVKLIESHDYWLDVLFPNAKS